MERPVNIHESISTTQGPRAVLWRTGDWRIPPREVRLDWGDEDSGWTHILDKHRNELGDPELFQNDVRTLIQYPLACGIGESADHERAILVGRQYFGCSSDNDCAGEIIKTVTSHRGGNSDRIITAYPVPRVTRDQWVEEEIDNSRGAKRPCRRRRRHHSAMERRAESLLQELDETPD